MIQDKDHIVEVKANESEEELARESGSDEDAEIDDGNQVFLKQSKKKKERKHEFSLYLGFPKKLDADRKKAKEDVKALASKIKNVRVPRQKSARYCLVDFETKKDRDDVRQELTELRIGEKRLTIRKVCHDQKNFADKVKLAKERKDIRRIFSGILNRIKNNCLRAKKNQTNVVYISKLPSTATESDIKKILPNIIDLHLKYVKGMNEGMVAFATLRTPKEALSATRIKNPEINGNKIVITIERVKSLNDTKRGIQSDDDTAGPSPKKSRYYGRERLDSITDTGDNFKIYD